MGRRLILILTVALTIVGQGVRQAPAEPEAPPPADAEKEKEAPAPLPAPPALPSELEKEPAPSATGQGLPLPAEPAPSPGPAQGFEPIPGPPATPAPAEEPAAPRVLPLPMPMPKARPLGAEAMPPAPEMPPAPAPLDPKVRPSQAPGAIPKPAAETNPLPPATDVPGAAPPAAGAGAGAARDVDRFVLTPDELHLGRQAIGLTVDVVGPPTLNINQTATLKIVVKNTGATDVRGAVVRDELPENLAFESSQPEAQSSGRLLFWKLGTIPAGTERSILVRVKPTKVGAFDHAATVTMLAGGKSQTIVREPKLKVEQSAATGKVLKGQQIQFKIAISNPGDGPARDVVVQAKLSPGLRHESDPGEPADRNQLFEQTIPLIKAGERVELETLVADTVLGGDQSCLVVVQSPDVTPGGDEAKSLATVTVVEPKLRVAITGPPKRFTDTLATYSITLENPGTSTARNVQVLATLPVSGQLAELPPGAKWNRSNGRLSWSIPQVEPGEKEKVTLAFKVRMGGISRYEVGVEARTEGGLYEMASCHTDVVGFADVVFDVTESRRSVDVGDETTFRIKIKNLGTKEATRLQIKAELSLNFDVTETAGTDQNAHFLSPTQRNVIVFPLIDRLGAHKEMELGIKVRAKKDGLATCRVYLVHDEMDAPVDDVAYTRVTNINRQ